MIYLRQILFFMLLFSVVLLCQTESDTLGSINKNKEKRGQINQNARRDVSNEIKLFSNYFSVPLNLKIYQKILINDYVRSNKFSPEELRTGMSHQELTAFEEHRLNTKKILSDIYGEDLIDVEGLLSALGITKEQIIAVAAILRFFLM